MKRLFTSESVSEGHPDKVADQISDAILDAYLAKDKDAHVAVETLVTTDKVVVAGEIKSHASVNISSVVRDTIKGIGYTEEEYGFSCDTCGVEVSVHTQSSDIDRGVSKRGNQQGAGDQGIMFGYATNETATFMPVEHYLSTLLMKSLSDIRKDGRILPYLRPDAKSQVTIEYEEEGKAKRIDTIVLSTQHDEFASERQMQDAIRNDVILKLIPYVKAHIKDENILRLFNDDIVYHVNPTGKFVLGGPAADSGLTGRKIIVDTYGGKCPHGGGAFSGKDPSKVDRSAAYAARYVAKNLVAQGMADKMQIQLAYAIGLAEPVSICVDTFGTSLYLSDNEIAELILKNYDLSPYGIGEMLNLKKPIYLPTAAYGHFGRTPYIQDGYQYFPWEVIKE